MRVKKFRRLASIKLRSNFSNYSQFGWTERTMIETLLCVWELLLKGAPRLLSLEKH